MRTVTFSYDLAELGRYYRWYHGLMAHWRSVLPAGAMLDVVYEDVVDNLEEQARRLIDYCGLPWDDRCLSFHETSRPIATSSNVQVRQPLYRSSLGAGAATKLTSSRCWPSSRAAARAPEAKGQRHAISLCSTLCSHLVVLPNIERGQRLMTTASPTPGEPAELDALVALAQREHRAGRLAEAAAAYRKILALRPDIAEMYNYLGNVLLVQGKLDEAAAEYERATALKPDLFPSAQQPGQHPPAAGQARPGRGTVSSKRSLCGPILPSRTTTWATSC